MNMFRIFAIAAKPSRRVLCRLQVGPDPFVFSIVLFCRGRIVRTVQDFLRLSLIQCVPLNLRDETVASRRVASRQHVQCELCTTLTVARCRCQLWWCCCLLAACRSNTRRHSVLRVSRQLVWQALWHLRLRRVNITSRSLYRITYYPD